MIAGPGSVHDERTARAVRRALIREHHPDRGGDVDTFVRLLDRLDAADAAAGDPARTLGRSRRIRALEGTHGRHLVLGFVAHLQ